MSGFDGETDDLIDALTEGRDQLKAENVRLQQKPRKFDELFAAEILHESFGRAIQDLLDDSKQTVNFEDGDVLDALVIEFNTTAGVLRRLNVLAGYYKGEIRVRNPDVSRIFAAHPHDVDYDHP